MEAFLYGKFAEILKKSGRLNTEEIRDKILNELHEYNLEDDVTMVILKKL
jgi:hypothetical protein